MDLHEEKNSELYIVKKLTFMVEFLRCFGHFLLPWPNGTLKVYNLMFAMEKSQYYKLLQTFLTFE